MNAPRRPSPAGLIAILAICAGFAFVAPAPRSASEGSLALLSPVDDGLSVPSPVLPVRSGAPDTAAASGGRASAATTRNWTPSPEGSSVAVVPAPPRPRATVAPRSPKPAAVGSTPTAVATRTWLRAIASSYGIGDGFLGKHMACGGSLTADDLTVAHKTLPCGTRVTFRFRGHVVTATVRDRGPYVAGRTWDFGPAVARALHFDGLDVVEWHAGWN